MSWTDVVIRTLEEEIKIPGEQSSSKVYPIIIPRGTATAANANENLSLESLGN